jgi:hypothetical protein
MAHVSRNPYDSPPLRGLGPVQGTLRVFVALQCWGYAAAHLHFGAKSAMARMLEREFYLPVGDTQLFDLVAAVALALAGMSCLLRPAWPVLLGLFLGQVLFVGSKAWLSEESHPALILMQHGSMLFSPVILACADLWPSKQKFSLGFWIAIAALMRLAICASLIGLGLQAILDSHNQGELLRVASGTLRTLTGQSPDTATAQSALCILAAIQLGLGITLLLARSRPAASLAVLVGVLTAASFSLGLGLAGYPRTLTHLILAGMPAALGLFWMNAIQEGEFSYVPEGYPRLSPGH